MKKKLTPKQLINEELARRSFNQKAKDVLKSSNPSKDVAEVIIEFVCECSNETCRQRVPLTIPQYEKIHTNQARFVLANGHERTAVDKVRTRADSFTIVEKPALRSAAD